MSLGRGGSQAFAPLVLYEKVSEFVLKINFSQSIICSVIGVRLCLFFILSKIKNKMGDYQTKSAK